MKIDRFRRTRAGFEPAYLDLHRSGVLRARVEAALEGLAACDFCPRLCKANRLLDEHKVCETGRYAIVSSHFPHMGEEDCLRGFRGSGTIFFSNCNLRCVFCQNFDISQQGMGNPTSPQRLAEMMLELQASRCHNINFVTPEHVVPQVLEALLIAIEHGLRLPLVYNTSGYDCARSLALLDGVIDIYMPDFKIWDPQKAARYLKAKDYPQVARSALMEMHRQVGPLTLDENGIALRGLLLRHLVMPQEAAGTGEFMRFLAAEVSADTFVNLMGQYRPAGKVGRDRFPEINRPISHEEFERAYDQARQAGIWRFDQRWLA